MSAPVVIALWWLAFGGSHVVLSSRPIRAPLVRALTLRGFKGLYSLVSFGTFVPLVAFFWGHRHAGALLFYPATWFRHVAELLMLAAFLFLVLGQATLRPGTTQAEMSGRHVAEPRGIHRVTRHPQNTAFALFGLAHLLPNPYVGDWVFFGGFVVFAVVGAWHQDLRLLSDGSPEFRSFHATTSALPFAAIVAGRQRVVFRELAPWAIGVAVVLWVALRVAHPSWIGGFGR